MQDAGGTHRAEGGDEGVEEDEDGWKRRGGDGGCGRAATRE